MEKVYDLIIIGAGPAGLTASIYAKRAMLDFLFLEKWLPGGEIANTYEVENYPGINYVSGAELADKMIDHTKDLGIKICLESVEEVDFTKKIKKIVTNYNTYYTKTVLIATGASSKKLGLPNEDDFRGRGISYCAVCDGALFKDKTVAVVGGGDVAVEDVIYLSRVAKKVYLIHRRDTLRAAKRYQEKMFKQENVEIIWDSEVKSFNGKDFLESIDVVNKKTKDKTVIDVNGVFVAIGMIPNISFLKESVKLSETGWIITDEFLETSVEGVFAAGDVRDTSLRQVVTSVSDGAMAVSMAQKYL
ncbi:thioredoxin-disulfide reductase [Candidatus Izemoplasma sp. B36]|uniref:thioredoxin-disulfide reductase n=1 Tax=Candidatus Izemoplasma sp. B36 TaxID=3242468 RepID=UPI003555EA56